MLFAVAFSFCACNNDDEPEPEPTPWQIPFFEIDHAVSFLISKEAQIVEVPYPRSHIKLLDLGLLTSRPGSLQDLWLPHWGFILATSQRSS